MAGGVREMYESITLPRPALAARLDLAFRR